MFITMQLSLFKVIKSTARDQCKFVKDTRQIKEIWGTPEKLILF